MIGSSGNQDGSGQAAPRSSGAGPLEITSDKLFAGGSEVNIRHGEDLYRLRRTSKGKLILTK